MNDWEEITLDNEEKVYDAIDKEEPVVIAVKVGDEFQYCTQNTLFVTVHTLAKYGGSYYIILKKTFGKCLSQHKISVFCLKDGTIGVVQKGVMTISLYYTQIMVALILSGNLMLVALLVCLILSESLAQYLQCN